MVVPLQRAAIGFRQALIYGIGLDDRRSTAT